MSKSDLPALVSPGFLHPPQQWTDPESAKIAIIPVPYDMTSSWKKGADRGPQAILDASAAVEWYDIETQTEPGSHGIITHCPIECRDRPEQLADLVAQRVADVFARGQLPVILGGEHSVSIGAIQETARRHDDLTVLQIDAHGDTRESYEGSTHNHACVMARAREVASILQVGIRAIDASEAKGIERDRVVYAHEILDDPNDRWIESVVKKCSDRVYITIDLDAFDPSIIPATGTPEPGGLTWHHVMKLLDAVTKSRQVVAFDVVELLPQTGHHASDFTAAKLVYRLIAMIFANQRD